MNKLITAILLLGTSLVSFGQKNSDIAYININEIMSSLPATDSIQKAIEEERLELEKIYGEMNSEYKTLLDEYEAKQDTYSELIKKTKGDELLSKQIRLQEFEKNANNTLQQHNIEMLQPLYAKVNAAIQKLSEEKGIDYVFDLANGAVVFTSEEAVNLNEEVIALVK